MPVAASDWAFAALAFAAGFLVYANTLGHRFVWDDLIWLDQKIRFYKGPLDVFFEPADLPTFRVYRPLTQGTYWIDQLLWWRNPLGFHLTSVTLHAIASGLVYAVTRRLGASAAAALVGALLFAVHPVHTESVAWITSRVDVLATVFVLLAVLAFERWRDGRSWTALATITGASFLAASSKETGAVVPLLLAARTFTLAFAGNADAAGATPRSRGSVWRTGAAGIVAAAGGVAMYLLLRPSDRSSGLSLTGYGASTIIRLLGAFGFYVLRAVLPIGLDAYVPEAPGDPLVLALGAAAVALTIFACVRARRAPLHAFAILWFAIALGPSVLVVLAELSATAVAERYLYLPSVGLGILVAAELTRRPAITSRASSRAAIAAVLLVLTGLTLARNRVWYDDITLWSDQTRTDTRHALPAMNLGVALMNAGRLAEAEQALQAALGREATETLRRDSYVNLGLVELRLGHLEPAEQAFTSANALGRHAVALTGLAQVARIRANDRLAHGDEQGATAELLRAKEAATAALAINPRNALAHYVLAGTLYQLGDVDGAVAAYRRVVEIAPDGKTGADAAEALRQLTE